MIEGYVEAIIKVAQFAQDQNIRMDQLGIKAVITTTGVLFPWARDLIEAVFGCPVIDRYGCREASTIAQQCVAGVIHVCHDWLHVEIVDDAGQPMPEGEPGQVVVTSLFNLGMPLLRYTLDDVARWRTAQQPCVCGNPFPALECIEGRVSGLVVFAWGRLSGQCIFCHPPQIGGRAAIPGHSARCHFPDD